MTITDVLGPVMLPAAIALACIATLLTVAHVARRYPTSPKRVPLGFRIDGRPRGLAPKALLWFGPLALVAAVGFIAVLSVVQRVPDDRRTVTALVFVVLAECAALVAWATDRQIEFARKQTFRIAPSRMLLVALPLLATVAVLIVVAIRDSAG